MTEIRLAPWIDTVVDRTGHNPRSDYVAAFWLPVTGPSATWLWRFLAVEVMEGPATVDRDLLGASIGINKPKRLELTIKRLCDFRCARWNLDVLEVRRHLPDLPAHFVAQLPEPIRRAHAQAVSNTVRMVSP